MKPLLILFVHGLGATSENTWGQFRRVIDEDDTLGPLADVKFFGFKTAKTRFSLFPSSRKQKVSDLAKGLRTEIDERYRDYRSIVLVGHSMGGLVVRQYLVTEVRDRIPLRVNKAVLFAVPNQGSELAAVANLFSVVHAQLADLTPDSPFLESLNDDWRHFDLDARVDVTHVVAGLDEAVREQSAVGLFGRSRVKLVADKSHSELVAVADSSDLAFLILRNAVLDFARCVGLTAGPSSASPQSPPPPGPSPLPRWSDMLPVAPADIPAAQVEPPTTLASHLSVLLAGRSPAGLTESFELKPRLEELFDVITDFDDVAAALFRVERNLPLAPYDVEYVNVREGLGDVQQVLETKLREAKGRLLLCGPRGIGKTREVAELARAARATKWSVLVARTDGDARLGPVLELPPALADARMLIVIDNLHTRILATTSQPGPPYVERLHRLLESLERVLPGSVRVVTTARDEPRFQSALQLSNDHDTWHTFGVCRLPKFTDESLCQILTTLAARAQVAVGPEVVPKLIENSDRKPETIFINVDLARRMKTALTSALWKPTEGESWRLRFVTARAEQAGVDPVARTIHLFINSGLQARVPYVIHVATALSESHAREAIDSLVGEGLLRLRQGVVTPFSPEQLAELVAVGGAPALALADHDRLVETAVVESGAGHPEQIDDLLALALALERSGRRERAEAVATSAVTLGPANARARRIRSTIRFGRADFTGAESDLSGSLEIGGDDVDTRLLRACIRNLLGNHTGTLDDLELVVKQGRDDAIVKAQRSTALFQLGRWSEAETSMTAEIERGNATGMMFFNRGIVRLQLKQLGEAEQDFSDALGAVVDLSALPRDIQQLERGLSVDVTGSSGDASGVGDAMIYGMRGWIRLQLGRNAEAEEDLTTAIDKNAAGQLTSLASAMRASTLPMMVNAVRKLEVPAMVSEGAFYHVRGLTRLNMGKLHEAVADFDEAIARSFVDGEVYYSRGVAHMRLDEIAEAERDAGLAIAAKKEDAATFTLRGAARLGLKQFAGAEDDLDRAIALDPANVQFYSWRAAARLEQRKAEAAESDLTAVLNHQPDDARTYFARGLVRFDLGRFAQAEEDLTIAIARGQTDHVVFGVRGLARLMQNNVAEAADDAEIAIDEGRGDMQAYSLRAAVGLVQGRYQQAESDLNAAIDRGRGDEWVFANRGKARHELQRYAEAEQDFTAAIDLGTQDADLIVQRARARLAQDKGAEAEQDIRRAMAGGRDDAFVHFSLGRAHQQQRRYEEAEAEFSLAVARDDEPTFRRSRGYARLVKGDATAAVLDFDLVIAASPNDGLTLYLRALARFTQGLNAEARADCDAALALSANESSALTLRAFVGIREMDLDAAARDCDRLEATAPATSDSLACQGALYLARGQFDAALLSLRSAAAEDKDWRASFGLALLLAGRLDDAKDAYQQVAASSLPFQKLLALADLDFQLHLHQDRVSYDEIGSAVAFIRSTLAQHAGHQMGLDGT